MKRHLQIAIILAIPILVAVLLGEMALAHETDPTPPGGNIVCNPYMLASFHLPISGCSDDDPGWSTNWGNPDPADRKNLTKDRIISTLMPAGNYKIRWENQCGYNSVYYTQGGVNTYPAYSNVGQDWNSVTGWWDVYETDDAFYFDPADSDGGVHFEDHDNCGPGVHLDNTFMFQVTGGWEECTTVDDADFDSGASWTLGGGASITDSTLSLDTAGYATQPFSIQSKQYTVTVVARRITTGTNDSLAVALSKDGEQIKSTVITVTADGSFYEIESSISPDVLGDGELMVASNQGTFEVDYICLHLVYGTDTCASELQTFDFEDGYNVGDEFDPYAYGFSQGWRGIAYPVDDTYEGIPEWYEYIGDVPIGPADGNFESIRAFTQKVVATIEYNYMVVPELITVTSTLNPPFGSAWVQVLTTQDGNSWSMVGEQAVDGSGTYTFSLDYASPVYVAVAQGYNAGIPVPVNAAIINQVEMEACYGGPQQFSTCLIGDPDFDEAGGFPSQFYWRGDYNAAAGAATLQEGGFIYQDFIPPWAGRYNVQVTGSSTETPCSWDVETTNYGSPVEIGSASVQCLSSQQTYTQTFDLPGTALTLWIRQSAGKSSISRVCIVPAIGTATECLNPNPDMLETIGYLGNYNRTDGEYHIPDGGKILATGVVYDDPPYLLETILVPLEAGDTPTVTITTGGIPGSYDGDQSNLISGTTYITYPLYLEIPGDFGPTIWNLGQGGVQVLRYCIRPDVITETETVDPFLCSTVQNPDFVDGLSYWDSDNVIAFNGLASFGSDAFVSQGLGDLGGPYTSTIRWLGDGYISTVATLTVASDAGVFNISHEFSPGDPHFWDDTASISGTTTITVSSISSGLNLDFICLYTGEAGDEPPDLPEDEEAPGEVEVPEGGLAECVAPPMGILPSTITDTLSSIWPWSTPPTYYEMVMMYNTAWVRFIGCRLDGYITWFKDVFWGKPWHMGLGGHGLRSKLDQIIFLLGLLNFFQAIEELLDLFGLLLKTITSVISAIGSAIVLIVSIVGIILTIVWMVLSFVLTLFVKLFYGLANPCSDVTIGTDNYAILAGWQFAQDAIATTPLVWLTLLAANILILKFFMWVTGRFK